MVEEIVEVFEGACRAAMEKRVEFPYNLITFDLPQMEIVLPFSIAVQCDDSNNVYVVKIAKESRVRFAWKSVYYRRQGENEVSEISLTSMNVLQLLLLYYLEKYAGVLSKMLEFAKKRSQEAISGCRETAGIALASKLLL